MDPTASASMLSPSSTPNTRESTSFGEMRWSSVRPATSPRVRPPPAIANRIGALTAEGVTATRPMGTPKTTAPAANGGVSRLRPTSTTVAVAPRTAPAPNAALR